MNRFCVFLIIGVIPFLNCQKGKETSDRLIENKKDTLIVFFNIKKYSRKELSQFIKRIDELEPKIIALNVLFRSLKNQEEDSLLASSISNARNVILSASVRNSDLALIRSDSLFTSSALGEGVISYHTGDDSVATDYVPLFENDSCQMLSFPNLIAANYAPEARMGFTNLRVNRQVQIRYSKTFENFRILDNDNLSSEFVKNKIVILGYLEPGTESSFISIEGNSKIKTYSVVVTANIILNLFSEKN